MAGKHTNEIDCLSLKEKENHPVEAKRIYANRIVGCNRYYRVVDGDIDAGTGAGEEAGKRDCLSGEPAPMGPYLVDVCEQPRWLFHERSGRKE
jgi:hypothetical protein